ncbi:transposase [Mangrovicoccus sp. HB182678]|uniref:Transposase n=1 Tax=Mangrovicoccus algicola TaxID=2771008 RepID=A0A8J6YSX6_9RHOB|nr:transposase [Mangrovicoccus algicola]
MISALNNAGDEVPGTARAALDAIPGQLCRLGTETDGLERRINAWHRTNEISRRLGTNPGIGPITAGAIAIAAAVPGGTLFRSGRPLAAWLGPTPRARSSGGERCEMHARSSGLHGLRRPVRIHKHVARTGQRLAARSSGKRCDAAERHGEAEALAHHAPPQDDAHVAVLFEQERGFSGCITQLVEQRHQPLPVRQKTVP